MNITIDTAKTIQIDHPEASYGIFCFNTVGDLFITSDWGFYAYSWRSFGKQSFESFLSKCNSEYLMGKLQITQINNGREIYPIQKENLTILINAFIDYLNGKQETQN
ncbi:hypothetical protein CMU51_00045 [Elizabethkingia anophelis]|uniref:Uncharacterized protein n=1 Tax=Elizabethkingia anophelis TaxID=1117645 RepID=A0AAE4NX73_9FLAO|nr:hypothetical protein [Elizabethkingia anophelis]